MFEISRFDRGVRVCVVLLTLGCVIVGAGDLGAVNRYYFSWVPDTLIAFPGDSLRLEVMLEHNDTIHGYNIRCLVSSDALFDSVTADWHGGDEESTAAEVGNITWFAFGWIPGEFGGYAHSLKCDPGAPPGTHVAVYLDSWVSGSAPPGSYTITSTVPFPSGFHSCDGTWTEVPVVTSVVRIPESSPGDVGPISIRTPPRYVYQGSVYGPAATIKNFGGIFVDSIQVCCSIDTGGVEIFVDTVLITGLYGYGSRDVTFSEWTVPRAYVDYDVTVLSFHPEDPNPANDTLTCQVLGVIPGDVGTVMIESPPESVYVDSIYYPRAIVTNHSSDSARAFSAVCELRVEGFAIWTSTKEVGGLAGNDTISVTFDWWLVQFEEDYDAVAYTVNGADENAANDTVTTLVCSVFPPGDICPVSIKGLPDTVCLDSIYRPSARIENTAGDYTGVFSVFCQIDSAGTILWTDVAQDSGLGGFDTITVDFSDWSVPAIGRYGVTVFTAYQYDTIPNNDTILVEVSAIDPLGLHEEDAVAGTPSSSALLGSHPNPMSNRAEISYRILKVGLVTVSVHDGMGRTVRTLLREVKEPGHYGIEWDGNTESGAEAPSGMYFCRLSAPGCTSTKKIVLLR